MNRNQRRCLVGIFIAMLATTTMADDGIGIGAIVGEPTGLSIKAWLSSSRAIDAAAAWSFSDNDSFQVHTDYLFHRFGVLHPEGATGRMPFYYGLGARVKLKDDDSKHDNNDDGETLVGIRLPIGLAYMLSSAPVDIFFEIVPILDVAPDSDFDLNAAIGVRYYFR